MNTVFTYAVNASKGEPDFMSNSRPLYNTVPDSEYVSSAERENLYHFHYKKDVVSEQYTKIDTHYHTVYEILVYISGKAKFRIGTAEFRLNPYDIIIVPPYTVHCTIPKQGECFERYVFNIFPDFFRYMDCSEYTDAIHNMPHLKYKIPGHIVSRSSVTDILTFFGKEYNRDNSHMKPMVNFKIAELLYHINTFGQFEGAESTNSVVEDMIEYIDKNYSSVSRVSDVTDNFFYSKNHLCKLFRNSTGITLPRYINMKKMENVEKLYKSGKSLTHACIESGFSGYNNFAYIYKSEFGVSPKNGMKNGR